VQLQFEEILKQELGSQKQAGPQSQSREPQLMSAGSGLEETPEQQGLLDGSAQGSDDVDVVLDWKGDPMVIKPGDRMPKWL